jgi:uncharacterized protein
MPMDLEWESLRWQGIEHVVTGTYVGGFRADGLVVLGPPLGPVSVSYQVECDASWRVTGLTIHAVSAADHRNLVLRADHNGHWRADGQPLPDLAGCIDIDISLTPLTNTLPIRRLAWEPGRPRELDVVYVNAPDLRLSRARQRYTLLGPGKQDDTTMYRYESRSFQADLTVDGDGFVIDYPGIWRRVWPSHETTSRR